MSCGLSALESISTNTEIRFSFVVTNQAHARLSGVGLFFVPNSQTNRLDPLRFYREPCTLPVEAKGELHGRGTD
jgi:hypothetical protein